MKKIAVVTWYESPNYGTCIQCYALVEFLKNNKYEVYVPDSFKYYYGFHHLFETIQRLFTKLNQKLTTRKIQVTKEINEGYYTRLEKNKKFAIESGYVKHIDSKETYEKMCSEFDVYITGSDQIWNPGYVTPPYLLSFVNNDKKKVAFGSSIGVSVIPKNKIKMYRKYLSQFNAIGVREKTAEKLLSDLLKKKVETVLDPTFLLDRYDWEKMSVKPKNLKDSEYIFCYFVGTKTEWINDVKQLSQETGLPVYIALSESKIIPSTGIVLSDIGVAEFVYCIQNAKHVITDSFHAVAISINSNTEFSVYKRFDDTDLKSQNSRIVDILSMFDLGDRIVENTDKLFKNYNVSIDFDVINSVLFKEKELSRKFLLNSIEGGE